MRWVSSDDLEAYLFRSGNPSPVAAIYRTTRTAQSAPWGTPAPVNEINGSQEAGAFTVSADGLYALISGTRTGGKGAGDIWATSRPDASSPWTSPTLVSELSTSYNEGGPSLSADGLTVFFASNRPGSSGYDIYTATRKTRSEPFSTPTLVAGVDSSANELYPMLSPDGADLYFSRNGSVYVSYGMPSASATVVTDATWRAIGPADSVAFESQNPGWNSDPHYDDSSAAGWSEPRCVHNWEGTLADSIWSASIRPVAYFRRVFALHRPVARAVLSGGFDDDGRIWINGMLLYGDIVPGANSFYSLDVSTYLKAGDNLIAARGLDYDGGSSAGFAALMEIAPVITYGDIDEDGDVDLTDYAVFQACFNGPNRPFAALTYCPQADADNDADVDLKGFIEFQGCFNGSNRPPSCK
jgi:Tol biopolymer transport system component